MERKDILMLWDVAGQIEGLAWRIEDEELEDLAHKLMNCAVDEEQRRGETYFPADKEWRPIKKTAEG